MNNKNESEGGPLKVPKTGCKEWKLLNALRNANGREVARKDLEDISRLSAVHSGVSTLRALGWTIKCRMERHTTETGWDVLSFYRLEEE